MRRAAWLGVLVLAVSVLGSTGATAASGARSYDYLIGTGVLCDLDPSACPAFARADNGDTVEITGSGSLTLHPKSVTGSGTLVHRDPAGNVVGEATWTATELLGFNSYGSGSAQGLPPEFEGGNALIRIHAVSLDGTLEADGVLTVDCELGKVPPGAQEGVTLVVQGFDLNFNKSISGFTVFVRTA